MAAIDPEDYYPPGFPIPAEDYDEVYTVDDYGIDITDPDYTDQDDKRDDDRTRNLRSLYPYEFLDPNATLPDLQNAPEPLGALRKEMVQKMQKDGESGEWALVEFVPAWTDPDWSDRFVYTGPTQSNDPLVKMYMKPGMLQKQRPALLPADIATRGPTEAAKRFGIDPAHHDDPFYRHSGVTPTTVNFTMPLGYARVTPSNQGERNMVDVDDLKALAAQFEVDARNRGSDASEEAFRTHLEDIAGGSPSHLAQVDAEIADALLLLLDKVTQREEQEEYQRFLFAGNTSNELVQNNVWTLGMDAVTDLATPLHELVTQDKWEITDLRSDLDPQTGVHTDPRNVYNISGQQGEYCMSNKLIRAAIQPALQLVSKVLYSDHPITWAWADIYRLRPVRGPHEPSRLHKIRRLTPEHYKRGIMEQEYFAIWLGDYDESNWFPEVEDLNRAGFDSIKYTCEVLKRTIQWEFRSKFDEDHDDMDGQNTMGQTQVVPQSQSPEMPFIIRICLSAEYIWPLLVQDYSTAEKAACSFTLAATMLHELSHAICFARQQLLHPSSSWVNLNPQWEVSRELTAEALNNLVTLGYRFVPEENTIGGPVAGLEEQDYFESERQNEEGFATENQYFGGASFPITTNYHTRFLDDLTIMGCLKIWPHLPGTSAALPTAHQVIPRNMILKFFTEQFWTHDMVKWGHQAMKIWPQDAPKMSTHWSDFDWLVVEKRFGRPARRWMKAVRDRMKYDDENVLLWEWLYYLTMTAVEPVLMMMRWLRYYRTWKATDKALWTMRNECSDRANTAVGYLQQLLDEINAWDGANPLPAPQVKPFRDCFNKMQDMHRIMSIEATHWQAIAVDYHRQPDQNAKDVIQLIHGQFVATRIEGIHLDIVDNCIQFLDTFGTLDQRVLDRLGQVPQLVELLTTGKDTLRANFVALRQLLNPVLLSFGPDQVFYQYKQEDFPGVASGNALDMAQRIEKMARRQLRKLSGPARNVADGWLYILANGDNLRNPVPGSADEGRNNTMDTVTDFIDGITAAQAQVVAAQYPDPEPQQVQQPVLETNQPRPDASRRSQRFVTASPGQPPNTWQTVYAEASGYIPYQDARTGFTRFHPAQIPDESTADPDLAARALTQGQALVRTLSASGMAALNIPGVDVPNINGQMTNQQAAALAGLVGLVRMREENNPFAPAANVPGARPALNGQQVQAISDLGDLIQARAAQIHANPELAGRVVPAAFSQGLQQIAGAEGERLTNTDVPGSSNLFGLSNLQRNWALQELENIVRDRAVGEDLMAQIRTQQPVQGNQQNAGIDPQVQGAPPPPRARR